MKIMIIGGDGFCGWPTSLQFAQDGDEVMIVDNLSRRKIDAELGSSSLIPIAGIEQRIKTANKLIGNILFENIDIATEYVKLKNAVNTFKPHTIVHFGEQRAAPYSMIGETERRYTVDNNISGTHNILNAIVEINPDIHLVHLGTMGVYGYNKDFGEIPEGYLDIKIPSTGSDTKILYPANPGSVYHMTKCLDQLMFQFYAKNWNLKITDLHQGIVWGVQTDLTNTHEDLYNRFDYDGIYGTVLNRFVVQSSNNHPLSVYGSGGQTRAFIHISDTVRCIRLAAKNIEFNNGKVRIMNQIAETLNVRDLATLISTQSGVEIEYLENPRKELSKNDLAVKNDGLKSLGFSPVLLNDQLLKDIEFLSKHADNFERDQVNNSPKW